MNTQGERLKAIRKALHLGQAEFGAKLNTKPNSLSMIETDRNGCTNAHLEVLFLELGVNPIWFFRGEGEMFTTLSIEHLLSTGDHRKLFGLVERLSVLAILEGQADTLRAKLANEHGLSDYKQVDTLLCGLVKPAITATEIKVKYYCDTDKQDYAFKITSHDE
jgi:transcriptional regulator with XRE-family HTH domain